MNAVSRNYDEIEGRDEILDALEKQRGPVSRSRGDAQAALPGQSASASEITRARNTVVSEEPRLATDPLPDLRQTTEIEFRGHTFEFAELGDSMVKAAEMWQDREAGEENVTEGTKFAGFIYELLAEKCTHPGADEAYWRQYDLQSPGDTDDLMTLFEAIIEAGVDIPEDAIEDIETFRDE